MANPSHSSLPGTYFVTSATSGRRSLFQVDASALLFMETLQHYRRKGAYRLHAFVVMRDHIHLLVTPREITIERAMGLIKGGFSHRMGLKSPVWQRGFTARRMRDAEEFMVRREYIHRNPVRARLVERAELYPYSSAYRPTEEKESISG